ncbi:metallophosphoesterase [Ferruginibacter lapsinanis]|uniref:metallophosphoesterase n=1 Tax=Ferruginibacter lapsinanis TaxID=563172 RepID=UPI001E3E6C1A|nr:metallophosphoesterase [Ferruginibacter lapsinanis]UEG49100.1 metallophosphoesterase [Ferruginibacter lapsinanis]
MRKTGIVLLTLFLFQAIGLAQDSIQARIILIGDAGQLTNGRHPVVSAVKRSIQLDEKTTIVFLGDNLYKPGFPDNSLPNFSMAKAPLDSQVQIAGSSDAKVYFVPGNHDWANGGSKGYESILREQAYIDFLGNKNVAMFPRDGCPGPEEIKINKDITLVTMDSQWWLQLNDKPGIESDCPYKTKAEVLVQLDDILSRNSQKLVILAFHHTFRSYSPHGGYFTIKQHIFPFTDAIPKLYIPLPVLGSVYPLTRAVFGTIQDLKHPLYQAMINEIENVVKGHPNVIYASGHDHSLQLIQDSGYNYIVSGSGSKNTRVSKNKKSLYASAKSGFVTLEISKNKNVQANVYLVDGDSAKMDYTKLILDFSKIPLPVADTTREVEYKFKDSVVISASDRYKAKVGFRKTFLGANYRKEWSAPVTFKEFNIRKEKGGLTIKSLGGGKQTKSLRLTDKNGTEWTLRSVDKDPEKALPTNLRGTLAHWIVQDMISASHPYAPLVVRELAMAVNVITPDPEFFFVPDDPALGQYRGMFANTVAMLENRDPGAGFVDTKSTNKVVNKMLEDNDHHIDQEKVLNARLLDMLVGDFDRHADQWKWGTADTGQGKLYYPVPKDRDQAFFNSNGLLLGYLSRSQMPFLQGFKKKIKDINGFNYVARDFDRFFMNNLDKNAWEKIIVNFQHELTDQVIDNAVAKFPTSVALLNAASIAEKLKSRRDDLLKSALKYYTFISKQVSVTGSNKSEYFHIKKSPDGLQLTVYKKLTDLDSASVMYNRVFEDNVTKELRLYGLNDNDKFEIDEDVSSKIKVRIIGGRGNDTFDLKGNVQNLVYDLSTEKNAAINLRRTNKEFSSDPAINEYKSTGFQYPKTSFPQIDLGYNDEDKILIGFGFARKTYGFRKVPFATDQKFVTLFAPHEGAYQIRYDGVFNKVISKEDIVIHSQLVNPTLSNFFGFGNQSVFDKSKPLEYYRVRYKYFETDLLIRRRYNDIFQFSIGPSYYQYWSKYEDNEKRILADPAIIGSDSVSIYGVKQFLGGKVKLDISYLNSEIFPTRGITWFTEFSSLRGLNKNAHALTKITSDMTIYASIKDPGRVGAVLRFGGGHIFSKQYEYFQALNMGANNFLRGYRKGRFSGSSIAYASTELRLKLFKSQSYLLPGDVGMMGFYDLGKVWQKGETSKKWHAAYGTGLYYIPYSLIMVSLTLGFSPEDKLFNFSLGTKFKLIF